MSLFQRIKTPFSELVGDTPYEPEPHAYVYAVGELLRDRRQELDLDLDSIGAALCIKPIYLAALEQGRAEDLPGPTYAVGFIRAYANYLGFDGERVLDAYKSETAEIHVRPDLALPVPLGERSVPGGPILVVALILALCGYGTWYYLSTGERSRPERVAAVPGELRQPTPPIAPPAAAAAPAARAIPNSASQPGGLQLSSGLTAPSEATAPPPIPEDRDLAAIAAAPVATPAQAVAVPPPADGTGNSATAAADGTAKPEPPVDIRALTDCWIQVRAADQSIVFSRVLKAGETYHVPRAGLVLRTGNAGALAIAVDGKPAPSIGGVGALRRNVTLNPDALLAGTAAHG